MNRFKQCMIVLMVGLGWTASTHAATVGFLAEVHTKNGTVSVKNIADSGYQVQEFKIILGDNTYFDTSALSLATTGSPITIGHDFTVTPGPDGYVAPTDTNGSITLLTPLAGAVIDGAQQATLTFTGFESGDAWGFRTLFLDGSGGEARGADMNNALIQVTFVDILNNLFVLSSTFEGGPTAGGNKGSFPFGATMQVSSPPPAPEVPVPASFVAGLALLGVYGLRRSRSMY